MPLPSRLGWGFVHNESVRLCLFHEWPMWQGIITLSTKNYEPKLQPLAQKLGDDFNQVLSFCCLCQRGERCQCKSGFIGQNCQLSFRDDSGAGQWWLVSEGNPYNPPRTGSAGVYLSSTGALYLFGGKFQILISPCVTALVSQYELLLTFGTVMPHYIAVNLCGSQIQLCAVLHAFFSASWLAVDQCQAISSIEKFKYIDIWS